MTELTARESASPLPTGPIGALAEIIGNSTMSIPDKLSAMAMLIRIVEQMEPR